MHTITAFTTLLTLSVHTLTIAAPVPPIFEPFELEIGLNTSVASMHHTFQTRDLMVKVNNAFLTPTSAHKFSVHKLNHTAINSEAKLCSWLTSNRRRVEFNVEQHTIHIKKATATTTTDIATATAMETDISNDKKAYDDCIKFVIKGLNEAKALAHRLLGMQKEAKEMMEAGAGGIEERKLKFWKFGIWWAQILCAAIPSLCHEEPDD
jgi:hypothetical protein